MGHVALALSRYAKEARREGLAGLDEVEMLAALLIDCVRARQGATPLGEPADVPDGGYMETPMLTKREAAHALRCSTRTVERLIAAGSLAAVKVEGSTRIRRADLDAYVEGLSARTFLDRTEVKGGVA